MVNPAPQSAAEATTLRRRAEARTRAGQAKARPGTLEPLSPETAQQWVHELQVHQIELELQNEELRRAQEELEAAKEKYFQLYDLAPVGYCVLSEQGLILEANLTAVLLLGMPRGELVGRSFSPFILPEDQEAYYHCRRRLLAGSESQALELRVLSPGDGALWVRLQASVARDAEGSLQIRLVLSDIAERKVAEAAQAASEALAHRMLHFAFDPMWLLDAEGRILDSNAATSDLYGYTPEELRQLRISDVEARESRAETEAHLARFLQTGSERFHTVHRRKDGSEFPAEVSLILFPDKHHLVATIRDETAQLAAQNQIADLYNHAPCGYHSIDANGLIVAINDTELAMLGYGREEILGRRTLQSLLAPDSLACFPARFAELLRVGHLDHLELEVVAKDGSSLPVLVSAVAVRDAQGNFLYTRSTMMDNRDRKRAEAVELATLAELERLVRERTAQVRQLAMEASQAEERERMAIASDLHDDLGQALLVLKLKLESLAKATGEPQVQALVADLLSLLKEASRTVRSLSSQLSPPVLKQLGLGPGLRLLAAELGETYGLVVQLAQTDCPLTTGDPRASFLYRATRELLINVVKHAGVQEAQVRIVGVDGLLELSVEDQGVGLDGPGLEEKQQNGFGLRSIRERLLFLGGDLQVLALPEGGTRVTLRLPLEPEAASHRTGRP